VCGEFESLAAIVAACADALPVWFPLQVDSAFDMADQLRQAVELAGNDAADSENIPQLGEGWVGDEALAISVYACLRHPDDFSEAIIAAVNHSGDADSTGAVAGNIMGAWLGLGAIDTCWTDDLELYELLLEIGSMLAASQAS
jgi:ADP-ribosylglycohydrolase